VKDHHALHWTHSITSINLDEISYPRDKFRLLKSVMLLFMRQEVREQCQWSAHILPGRPKPNEILEIVTFAAISALFKHI
jgi:hypothetical protein